MLIEVASASSLGGDVFFRPGELIVGRPDLPGRPGFLPLLGGRPVSLPEDLETLEKLSEGCAGGSLEAARSPRTLGRGDLGADGRLELVLSMGSETQPGFLLRVMRADLLVAETALPLPRTPCRALVAEIDGSDAPGLLVIWTSEGPQGLTRGVTVYRLEGGP